MITFELAQVQQAQDHRPQVERFIMTDRIVVIEDDADYRSVPADVQAIIELRNEL